MNEPHDGPEGTDGPADAPDDAPPEFCGVAKQLPSGAMLTCTRAHGHDEDHFDENAGLAWLNEGVSPAGLTQEERVHLALDRVGVPRGRNELTYSLVQRTTLFIDRIGKRLHTQVENNMIFYNTCKDAVTLLEGAPNAGNFRTRQAIDKLRAVIVPKKTPAGIHLQ